VSDDGRLTARLTGRIVGVTAGLVGAGALAGGVWLGADQALGVLAGGTITIANFLWLHWTATRALRPASGIRGGGVRQALWLGASTVRFGVVAVALGLVAGQGWVGLAGLVVSLATLPLIAVVEGLRMARAT
jgi:hypothetical protein